MDINNDGIANSVSQPLGSDTHNDASISQLISPDVIPSSQPLLLSEQSRVEIVTRHRVARRRRRRRTQGQHQQLAQQIRRRHMSHQYRQQQRYHRNDRYEGRDSSNVTRPQSSTVDEQFEEVIEERLQEVYDWEIIQLMDQLEQEQLNGLEGIAALEQLSVVQDEMKQSHPIQTSQALGEDEANPRGQTSNGWVRMQPNDPDNHLTPQSLDSTLYHMDKMR
ncbi:unnamed protein product [Didymodactylos carnosus]|uniref:Uncharacterized protein n=1 Tax=Didymodactylos carnosus TaxID=1234261 RepID=A0A816BPI7_9BILA|nr:unnamed protein product [Didymodactylos carnosus]CAF4499491.1 unnamed protein product [Didymodactylos carnosus]